MHQAKKKRERWIMRQYGKWMADSVIEKKINLTEKWRYEYGLTLDGIARVWKQTGDKKYLDFIVEIMDHFIDENGTIKGYKIDEYNLDHLNNGKIVLTLYQETKAEKYKKALLQLRKQIDTHPRTSEGIFWHKKIYPYQVWLDGLYMGAAFYAVYSKAFGDEDAFDDIAKQFILAERHLKDEKTGLLYHAWDESKEQFWADKQTGLSPNFWARGMGWFVTALADTLDVFPEDHKNREELLAILNRCVDALIQVQDKQSHVWYQILDAGRKGGNYLESSASSMIVYTLLKGIRKGYLPKSLQENAKLAYQGLLNEFVLETRDGYLNLNKVCSVAGLGGSDSRRDGTFAYYMSESIVCNEPKGLGPFILASVEQELAE